MEMLMTQHITSEHVGRRVIVTSQNELTHLFRVGRLAEVNESPMSGTPFRVTFDDDTMTWAHRVLLLPESQHAPALDALLAVAGQAKDGFVSRLAEVEDRIVRQQNQIANLHSQVAELVAARTQFEAHVVRVAKELAEELSDDGCTRVREAVENDLGLDWPEDRFTFKVIVEHTITATLQASRQPNDPAYFFQNSISVDDDGQLTVDSDWEVEEQETTVTDVSDVNA